MGGGKPRMHTVPLGGMVNQIAAHRDLVIGVMPVSPPNGKKAQNRTKLGQTCTLGSVHGLCAFSLVLQGIWCPMKVVITQTRLLTEFKQTVCRRS